MSYKAIIARIRITPIEGAKTLVQGHVLGYQVAVDKSTQDGSLGIFFPTDGQLSEAFAKANDLVGRGTDPVTGEKLGGYFSESRRVTTQKFMKGAIRSEGFFCPMSYLDFALPQNVKGINNLKEGDEFDSIMGIPICNKYFTPATLKAMERDKKHGIRRLEIPGFPEHFETSHWQRFHVDSIPMGTRWVVTEKLHGTSARVGNLKVKRKLKWWQNLLNYVGFRYQSEFYKIVVGSRRKVLNDVEDPGAWHSGGLRFDSANRYGDLLPKDTVIYYEIVGHEPSGKPIMGDADPSKLADKKAQKQWANTPEGRMRFKYGTADKQSADFLYRATSEGKELLFWQVENLCDLLGIYLPPVFDAGVIETPEDLRALKETVEKFTDGASVLDRSHIREGVAIRLEYPDGTLKILKNKSVDFGILEGYIKANDSYVDTEETA